MSASTPTQPAGPPVPPVKPILSSPGAYMANFQPSNPLGSGSGPVSGTPTPGGGVVAPITAGIHSSNKTHEKPTIAARPIPPPTLPKYSSSFNKIDRDRNEFTKLDKAEREKNNSASHLNNANSTSDKHSINSHTNSSGGGGGGLPSNNSVSNMNNTNNNNHNKSLSPGSSRSSVYISPVIINDSEEEDYLRPTAGRVFGTSTPSSASALFRRTTAYSSTPQARNTANAGHTPPASSSFGNHKSYLRHNNGAEALNESISSNGSASSETSASSSPFVSEYTKRLLQLRGETVSHESYNSAISSAMAVASSPGSSGGGGSNLNLNHSGAPISGNHFRSRYSVFPRYASDGGGTSSGINENDIVTHAVPSPDPPQIPLRAALGNLFAKLDEHYGFKQTFIPCALLCLFVAFLVFVAFMYMTISTDIASTLGTIDTKYDLCEGPAQDRGRCVVQSDIEPALELLKRVGTELKTRVEHSKCVDTSVTSYWMSADEVIRLAKEHDPSLLVPQAVKHLHTMEYLIGQNPQWRINHCDQDGNEIGFDEVLRRRASKTNYFAILKPKLPFTCMLYNKFHTFFVIVGVLGLVGIIAYLVNYFLKFVLYVKQKRKDQVNALISEIIQAVSQAAASAGGSESSDEGGLVVVNHLRDRLIAPDNRKKMEWAWLEALQFLEQHESRIQFEVGNRGGEDFKMMRWTDSAPLPTSTRSVPGGAKKWQSPAFDNTNKIPDPPTPCLKIRQMFDKYEVNDPNLRTIVQDAILEKVGARCKIYDIQLDRSTCCVYVRCATSQDAGIVHDEINGWWFDNRLVSIKFLRLERYLSRFPRALAGPACLKPSNRHNSSMPAAGPGANPLEREDDEDVEAEEDELDQELEC
uniref:Inner nuclear membrane protein Man1 n=1 Tax=Culex pipiens TaxID=7175 RepID=A0A8D8FQJ7_CULPI